MFEAILEDRQWFRSLWKQHKINTKAQEWLYGVVKEVNINNDSGNYENNNDDNNSKTQLFCFLIGNH